MIDRGQWLAVPISGNFNGTEIDGATGRLGVTTRRTMVVVRRLNVGWMSMTRYRVEKLIEAIVTRRPWRATNVTGVLDRATSTRRGRSGTATPRDTRFDCRRLAPEHRAP